MSAFLPQLRLRTECSFGKVYGKVEQVVDYLNLTGHTFVAVVEDSGTWSHVRFEKQMKKYPSGRGHYTLKKIKEDYEIGILSVIVEERYQVKKGVTKIITIRRTMIKDY